MDNNIELGLGKSTGSPDHGISLLDIPEDRPKDDTSLAAHIANFPAREATQSVCRTWITGLAATRQFDDRVDQSVIYCLGRDLWAVQSAADAMVLLSDQGQLTEGMKLLLARDIEATATEVRATLVSGASFSCSSSTPPSREKLILISS